MRTNRGRVGALSGVPGTMVPSSALRAHADRQDGEQHRPPDHDVDGDRERDAHGLQACSSSTSVPLKSLGCRNSTGLPCAPILGSPSPSTRAPAALSLSRAALMSLDLVADVVNAAGRVALQERRDRRALAQRLEQLDLGVGQVHEHHRDAVRRAPAAAPTPARRACARYWSAALARLGTAMATWLRRPIISALQASLFARPTPTIAICKTRTAAADIPPPVPRPAEARARGEVATPRV